MLVNGTSKSMDYVGRLAPIALFAYNRPHHLSVTIKALMDNSISKDSDLFIFIDGPKDKTDFENVGLVRNIAKQTHGFASVKVVSRPRNFGLSRSISEGVSDVLNSYDRVIVLEDDLIVSPYFLGYMNDALDLYFNDDVVASIHGYNYPIEQNDQQTYFLRGADCWGWGTWRRAWQHFNPDGKSLLRQLRSAGLLHSFDLDGAYPFSRMLYQQIQGKNDSWAIRWHASTFLLGMLTLYPSQSLVNNIGHDNSGTHSVMDSSFDVEISVEPVILGPIPLEESIDFRNAIRIYYFRTRGWWTYLLNVLFEAWVRVAPLSWLGTLPGKT